MLPVLDEMGEVDAARKEKAQSNSVMLDGQKRSHRFSTGREVADAQ